MNYLNLFLFVGSTEAIGLLGGFFSAAGVNGWYQTINKAPFNPPGWVFGPVWTILYFLMGLAAYLVWEKTKKKERNFLMMFYVFQLALNFIWSFLFFKLTNPLFALVDIYLLLFLLIFIVIKYIRVSKAAAYLMLLYVFWVAFASVLNLWVVLYN